MKAILLLTGLMGMAVSAQGQQPTAQQPVLPPGPLIQKHAPDFARWTDTLEYGSLDDLAASSEASAIPQNTAFKPIAPVVTTITKTGQILHVAMPQQGKTWSVWCIGAVKTLLAPDEKTCIRVLPSSTFFVNPYDIDFSQSDFSGFEWISLQNYSGIKTYNGKKCILFKNRIGEAYIDFATRLPVARQAAGEVHIYQFLPPPTENQEVPEVVQKWLAARKVESARMQRVPLPPF